MRLITLALVVLWAGAGRGESVIVGDKTVPIYGVAEFYVQGAGATVLWKVTPTPVTKKIRGVYLFFGGLPGTAYEVEATVIDFDKKTAEQVAVTVTFAGDAPPGPGPTPTPVDKLLSVFKTAAAAETAEDRALLGKLVEFYDDAATKIDDATITTWVSLNDQFTTIATSKGVTGRLPKVQQVAADELKAVFPTGKVSPDLKIGTAERAAAKKLLLKISSTLDKVGK